jgi:hypothetical protein
MFRMPPIPKALFRWAGCALQGLEREPPCRLAFSWSASGVVDTRVRLRLEPDHNAARVFFEYSGFDVSQPRGHYALTTGAASSSPVTDGTRR